MQEEKKTATAGAAAVEERVSDENIRTDDYYIMKPKSWQYLDQMIWHLDVAAKLLAMIPEEYISTITYRSGQPGFRAYVGELGKVYLYSKPCEREIESGTFDIIHRSVGNVTLVHCSFAGEDAND